MEELQKQELLGHCVRVEVSLSSVAPPTPTAVVFIYKRHLTMLAVCLCVSATRSYRGGAAAGSPVSTHALMKGVQFGGRKQLGVLTYMSSF